MKTTAEKIGERLKNARTTRGVSMGQLAKLCGWSGSSRIANYESGSRNIGVDDSITLGKVLGISPVELLFGEQANNEQWLTEDQQKLLSLFNQLPTNEQSYIIDLCEVRLKEIDAYVENYRRGRFKSPDSVD